MTHSDDTWHAESQSDPRTPKIRALNDRLRRDLVGGRIFMTPGVQGLGDTVVSQVLLEIMAYDDFTPDNDPYGEHDVGLLKINGETILWKIDYYDRSLCYGSPDPADEAVTTRVLTIMLSSEY